VSRFRRGALPLIYGHRGVRGPASETPPENTMPAFERAFDELADGIELDVRQASTGEIVVFHDPTLRRMTMGFDSRNVADLSWDELRRIDIGDRIPLLSDVLDWLGPTNMLLNVELKRDLPSRTGLVLAVASLLRKRKALAERLIISSFDPVMLAPLNVLLPNVPLGFLFHKGQAEHDPWRWGQLLPFQALHPEYVMVSRERLDGKIVNAWTVNDEQAACDLAAMGVDGIITDRPGAIRKALA
jgi:glycerophosphoryl diester phosphodiesterase